MKCSNNKKTMKTHQDHYKNDFELIGCGFHQKLQFHKSSISHYNLAWVCFCMILHLGVPIITGNVIPLK